ncbi:MAG: M48 family metalloprotease [Acidobacteriia bacterium]|nr:M48 family metalloprotease [Terriglobia bacterium]
MKRLIGLAALLAICGGVLYYSHRHKTEARVGPEAVLNALAETQRDLSRVPAKLTRLSDAEEIRIGDDMAAGYLGRFGAPHDAKDKDGQNAANERMQQYVSDVGRAVAAHARRKLPYKFHYIPNAGFVNAFALPGGHVFIGSGLIHLMESEDELASVLGHEVEHVDNYHCAERVQIEARLRNIPLGGLVALPIELFVAGYSKEQELEADRDGAGLAVTAGYSAQGAVHMFQEFSKLHKTYVLKASTPDEEMSQVAIEGILGYFRSHPLPEEREAQIKRIMAANGWPALRERPIRQKP